MQEQSLFIEALEKEDPAERAAFLDQVCAGDPPLRRRIDRLLERYEQEGSFMEPAAAGLLATAAEPPSEGPGTVIGPYKLMEQIGEGGMGLVFVAEQRQPVRRKVALKLIKPGMDSRQVIARFEAERQALALMDHPNIANVFDGGATAGGRPYFVMELVRGAPITQYCDDNRLTLRARLELFSHICAAVQHAHQKGIIHRDIKPSNALVVSHDGMPVVKVIDFGLAKAVGQQLTDKTVYTNFAQFMGTPLYMSPEQAGQSGLDVDTRTDIYALGVLLYELLTGTTPFSRDRLRDASYDEIRRLIREEEPPKPSTRLSTLGQAGSTVSAQRQSEPKQLCKLLRGELDWIVMKALEKDRNRRYESASALAADVQRYLQDEPVEACPPSRRYRLGKFLRKHRRGVLTAAALLAAAVVLGAGSAWVLHDRASRLAQIEQQVAEALVGARTAIEAADLKLASQRAAEAHGHLGAEREHLAASAAKTDRIRREIEARQAGESRWRQFLQLASDAQDKMGHAENLGGDALAKEALDLYGVLEADDWSARLDNSYLTADQKEQVRQTAYVTLVSLADWCVRWESRDTGADTPPVDMKAMVDLGFAVWPKNRDSKLAERGLDLLKRAEVFHEPTRAFYFVRSECHRIRGNTAAATEDVKRFQEATAKTAWDHYLPGHTAGRRDRQEAIRSYRAALALQPNHYNSLYYLADVFKTDEINRLPEAIQLFTACIALRPDDAIFAYGKRAGCYYKLGQMEDAEADLTAAIAASKDEMDRASSYEARRAFYKALGRTDKARADEERIIEVGEQAVEKSKAKYGPDDVTGIYVLAPSYSKAGRLPEAIALLEKMLEKRTAKLGSYHPDTLQSMANVGAAYGQAGRLQDSIALLEQTLEKCKAKLGPDHPVTIDSMQNLANVYAQAGRLQKAIALREQFVENRTSKLGPDHRVTIGSMGQLAYEYGQAGRLQDAIALRKRILENLKAKLGPDHPDTLYSMQILAYFYQVAGQLPEAIALNEQTLEKTKAKLGPDHPHTLVTMNNLAFAYQRTGKLDKADPLFQDCLERTRKKEGPKAIGTANALAGLGLNLVKQHRHVEAEPLLRECLAIREKELPDDWQRFLSLSLLGDALLGQRKYAAAEPLLLDGYDGMKQREAKISIGEKSRLLNQAIERIVRLYEATEQAEKVRTWREKLPAGNSPGD